jgi:proline iminopeptidase
VLPLPAPRAAGYTTSTPIPLYWAIHGKEGASRLLVLHGGPGAHHDYLLPQMLALGERYELVFYDQRGGGRSRTDDPAPITWRTHVEDLARVVAEMDLAAPSLIGYSWGGLLALLYALAAVGESPGGRAPEAGPAPSRLALVDPAPLDSQYRRQFEEEFARRQRGPEIAAMRDELTTSGLREQNPDAFKQRQFELAVAGYFHDPAKVAGLTPFRVTGRVQQSVWESLGDFDLVPLLSAVKTPALVVHGREDPIPLASSEAGARALGAELVVIDRCGHVPYVERPDALFPALLEFLQRTDARPGMAPPVGAAR